MLDTQAAARLPVPPVSAWDPDLQLSRVSLLLLSL